MKKSEAGELVMFILAAYPAQRQRMSDADVEGMMVSYYLALGDIETEAAKGAAIRAIRTSKFIPTVAEIREAVGVVVHGKRKTGLEAWAEVKRRLYANPRAVPGRDFQFDDPITAHLMPPSVFCELASGEESDLVSHRARFVDAYETAQARERVEAQANPGAVSKSLPGGANEAVAALGQLSSELALKFGGSK